MFWWIVNLAFIYFLRGGGGGLLKNIASSVSFLFSVVQLFLFFQLSPPI